MFLTCLILLVPSSVLAQSGTAEVGVFEPQQLTPGSTIQVPVSIRNVENLYGFDITIRFDPSIVQVMDADPAKEGVQVSLGNFLDPGLLLFNIVDNEAGTIRFTMSQYNPSEPKNGNGILLVIKLTGVKEGESNVEITDLSLSTRDGVEIVAAGVNSTITVNSSAPTQEITYPVAQVTGMIVINTFTPTPLVTKTATPTPTANNTGVPILPATGQPVYTNTGEETASSIEPEEDGFFLVRNWWIIAVLLVVVLGMGFYLFRKRKMSK